MKQVNLLQRQPDGTFIDWGRNATVNGVRGHGGAAWYSGEAAEVMKLILSHTSRIEEGDSDGQR